MVPELLDELGGLFLRLQPVLEVLDVGVEPLDQAGDLVAAAGGGIGEHRIAPGGLVGRVHGARGARGQAGMLGVAGGQGAGDELVSGVADALGHLLHQLVRPGDVPGLGVSEGLSADQLHRCQQRGRGGGDRVGADELLEDLPVSQHGLVQPVALGGGHGREVHGPVLGLAQQAPGVRGQLVPVRGGCTALGAGVGPERGVDLLSGGPGVQ